MPPRLSVVMPYYRNPRMLERQYRVWAGEYSPDAKAALEMVLIDDGSPEPAADVPRPDGLPALRIFRITVDRPWHQHAARNLGAHVAVGDWLALTDMDHVIPPDTLAEILTFSTESTRGDFATFGRVDAPPGEPWKADHASTMARTKRGDGSLKPHVNSFAMSRRLFWKVGGYDETYCGIYGTDRLFRDRLFTAGREVHLAHAPLIRVSRDVIADASTRDQPRKEGRPPNRKKLVTREKVARGEAGTIKVLQFPWEQAL